MMLPACTVADFAQASHIDEKRATVICTQASNCLPSQEKTTRSAHKNCNHCQYGKHKKEHRLGINGDFLIGRRAAAKAFDLGEGVDNRRVCRLVVAGPPPKILHELLPKAEIGGLRPIEVESHLG